MCNFLMAEKTFENPLFVAGIASRILQGFLMLRFSYSSATWSATGGPLQAR